MNVAAPPKSPPFENPWIRQHYEECGSPKSDAVERRDKADRQRRAGHQQYRECKHGSSTEPVAQRSPEQSAQRPHEKGYRECPPREQGRLACGAGEQSCGNRGQAIGIDAIIEPLGGVYSCRSGNPTPKHNGSTHGRTPTTIAHT